MNSFFVNIAYKIGIDKSIAYSSGSRVVGGITGVLSVFFISTFLTGVEQGFYYTFGSILAMQVFFELGLTGIMTQFVAHEVSHLTLNSNFEYEGEELYRSRLASLFIFCVKWYTILSFVAFSFLIVVGYLYFNRYGNDNHDVNWRIPWVLICVGTAIKLFQSPFNSIFMGLGKVKEMSKISFIQQLIIPLFTWIGLAFNFKLYVVGLSYLLSVLLWQIYVWSTDLAKIVVKLWKIDVTSKVLYWKEIFPFQWRIAISWVSGYFIFQLFNPVIFATDGAVVAGQMGMTLHALSAIQTFSLSWLNTKVPLYSRLIAINDFIQLDNLFNKTLKQMTSICFVLLIMFFITIYILNITHVELGASVLSERFLGLLPTFVMMIPVFLQQYINSWATYLRCHKKEPFLANSVLTGLLCCISIFYFGNIYGLYGVVVSYCVVSLLVFPWGYWIFKTKKAEWHNG